MWNAKLDEAQVGIKIAGRNISNLMAGELKSLLMKMKEESVKAGLKLKVQKTKVMESSPITSWQIDGETIKEWQTLFSWAPKSLRTMAAAMKLKDAYFLEEKLWQI